MKKLNGLIFVILVLLAACQQKEENLDFNKLVSKKPYTAIMFFAPDCPLCITFSKPFDQLGQDYPDSIQCVAVHCGRNYEPMELKMYIEETGLKAPVFVDRDYLVAHKFNASITPEFVLMDSEQNVLYQGLLDDRMKNLGVYKQHWDTYYLRDAIEAVLTGQKPAVESTQPIGCVLEY